MRQSLFLLLSLMAVAQEPAIRDLPRTAPYLAVQALPVDQLLPPPPAPDSPAGMADLLAVKEAQRWRTPEQVAWAKRADLALIWEFEGVMGPVFNPEKLPLCDAFFRKLRENTWQASQATKRRFPRLRPPFVDASLQPCVKLSESGSYPSGHSLQFYTWAQALAVLVPEQKAQVMTFADRLAWGRVLGGVHFPSDLAGGRIMAERLFALYLKNPAFQQELEACRREYEAARKQAGARKAS